MAYTPPPTFNTGAPPPLSATNLNTYLRDNFADHQGRIVALESSSGATINTYWRQAARAATTANITLSGTQTVDGVVLAVDDRVLVKNQTTASENGIYNVAVGAWTRSTDADTSAEVPPGMVISVAEGTVNHDTIWILTNDSVTLGSTALSFTPIQVTVNTAAGSVSFTPTGGIAATNVQSALVELDGDKANTTHAHAGTDITSGTVPVARLGSGTLSASTFLSGTGAFTTTPGSGQAINAAAPPYNASGAGTGDQGAAINSAITAAATGTGGAVFLPKGDYRITTALAPASNVTVFGEGEGTRITWAGTGTMLPLTSSHLLTRWRDMEFFSSATTYTLADLNASHAHEFTGVVFRGTHAPTGTAQAAQTGVNLRGNAGDNMFNRCRWFNLGVPIRTSTIQNYVNQSHFGECYYGVVGDSGGGGGIVVSDTTFTSTPGSASMSPAHIDVQGTASDWHFTNCWLEGANKCVIVGRSGVGGPSSFNMQNCHVASTTTNIEVQGCRQPYFSNISSGNNPGQTPAHITVDAAGAAAGVAINLIPLFGVAEIPLTTFPDDWFVLSRYSLQVPFRGVDIAGYANIQIGSNSPEGVATANMGSLYLMVGGSGASTLWRKASGTGNTGWMPVGGGLPTFNVDTYGAGLGNPTADQAAFTSAIAAAEAASTGGIVLMPSASYTLSGGFTHSPKVKFIGAGKDFTTLNHSSTTNVLFTSVDVAGSWAMKTACYEGFTIWGAGSGTAAGAIKVGGHGPWLLQDILVGNYLAGTSPAVHFRNEATGAYTELVTMRDCVFKNNLINVGTSKSAGGHESFSGLSFQRCQVQTNITNSIGIQIGSGCLVYAANWDLKIMNERSTSIALDLASSARIHNTFFNILLEGWTTTEANAGTAIRTAASAEIKAHGKYKIFAEDGDLTFNLNASSVVQLDSTVDGLTSLADPGDFTWRGDTHTNRVFYESALAADRLFILSSGNLVPGSKVRVSRGASATGGLLTVKNLTSGGTTLVVLSRPNQAAEFAYRSDGNFVLISPAPVTVLASDQTNATTSFADITGLSFAVVAGTTYSFKAKIIFSVNAATTGNAFSINGPATTQLAYSVTRPSTTATYGTAGLAPTTLSVKAYDVPPATASTPETTGNIAIIEGIIQPSANGTVAVRFASEVAVAGGLVAKAGSTLEVS